MDQRKIQSITLQRVETILQNCWMYVTVQKGVKSLGAFIQCSHRNEENGSSRLAPIARVVLKNKPHLLKDLFKL